MNFSIDYRVSSFTNLKFVFAGGRATDSRRILKTLKKTRLWKGIRNIL